MWNHACREEGDATCVSNLVSLCIELADLLPDLLARSKTRSHETPSQFKTHPPITLNFLKSTYKTRGPWSLHFKHSHWWKRWSRSKFASHYAWGTDGVSKWKINVKSTWNSSWYQIDHVSWSLILQKPPLGGRPSTKLETMALWNHTTVDLLYFIMCENPAWIVISWNSIWLRARLHMISYYAWGLVTTLHDFGSVLGWPLDTSFGLSQFHGHVFWLVYELTLNQDIECQLLNWMTFRQLRKFLIQSKHIHWTSHKFFICPYITYPTLNTTYTFHLPYLRYNIVWVILSKL